MQRRALRFIAGRCGGEGLCCLNAVKLPSQNDQHAKVNVYRARSPRSKSSRFGVYGWSRKDVEDTSSPYMEGEVRISHVLLLKKQHLGFL